MIFDPATLATAVSSLLGAPGAVPPGHKGAFVTMVNENAVTAVIAAKLGDHWEVQGTVDHPWTGGLDEGASIKATW